MSASKEVRVSDSRRRERPSELQAHVMPSSPRKQPVSAPSFETPSNSDLHELSRKSTLGEDDSVPTAGNSSADAASAWTDSSVSPVDSQPAEAPASPLPPSITQTPNVPRLSPTVHVRTSSLGISKSPESPRNSGAFASRRGKSIRGQHERRESQLGGRFLANAGSPPGSPQGGFGLSSSLRDQNAGAACFLELDTDSDEDSPFPPPISYTEQVSRDLRHVNPTVRVRSNNSVPVNNSHARKMLAGIRERRMVQDRSSQTPSTQSPSTTPPSPVGSLQRSPSIAFRLERGGVVVGTSMGPVQFGIPPETIKDSLALGFEVPQVYVVPRDRFDTVAGLNMCEIEFPGYYQFFIRQRSMTLVASAEAERSLRLLMHEILQGPPEAHLYSSEECLVDSDARPDHVKEMAYFVRPRNGRSIDVDSLFSFVRFEPSNSPAGDMFLEMPKDGRERADSDIIISKARLNENVEIHETAREWILYDKGVETARVEFWMASSVPPRFPLAMVLPTKTFVPPVLGVTVLGSSHGFDAKQSTSGFMLWMHGHGIMVDPPPNATDLLKRGGISPRWISALILTHCHADHDAGTFQKILVEGRVTLITTKTIMASFLRKYSKISGFTEAFLCRLFEPRVVRIGEDVFYGGGAIRFFYSLHALPCVGFQVSVAGKTIAYSADTLYDPVTLNQLHDEGVLSEGRRDSLLAFPFESADLVIHEAGIPPIHTPVEVLKNLSENAKSRLYVIHIAEAAAEASGLKLARAGTDHTIRVVEGDSHAFSLDVMTNSELFFPFLTSANKFGRGIVSAAQERMALMDYENPNQLDFSFLDCTNASATTKRYYTASAPGHNNRDRSSSIVVHRSSNLMDGASSVNARDSDLSLSSVKRYSAGFENVSPSKQFISGRRTSASTNKSPLFASDNEEEDFTVPQVADLLRLSKRVICEADQIVSANEGEGDVGLYLIMKGFCRVERTTVGESIDEDTVQPAEGPSGTILEPGDCFGLFVVNENRRNLLVRKCVIRTLTEVELFELNIESLWYLLNVYPALDRRLSRMHELRALEAWRTMELNSCLRRLASFQRTQLNAVLESKEFKKGEELWTKKPGPRNAFLLAEGQLMFSELSEEMSDRPFEPGAFLCDFHSMIVNRRPSSSSTISSSAQQPHVGPAAVGIALSAHVFAHVPASTGTDLFAAAEPSHNSSAQSLTSGEPDGCQQSMPTMTLVAKTDCRLYQINWRDALQFLESNPGVLVQIYHSFAVE